MKDWEEKRIKSLLMDAAYTGDQRLQTRDRMRWGSEGICVALSPERQQLVKS